MSPSRLERRRNSSSGAAEPSARAGEHWMAACLPDRSGKMLEGGATSSRGPEMATDDLVKRVREREPNCAKVGLFDMDGIFRGKYMGADKLASALAAGSGFCDVVPGLASSDQLYDTVRYTGCNLAYPDP